MRRQLREIVLRDVEVGLNILEIGD